MLTMFLQITCTELQTCISNAQLNFQGTVQNTIFITNNHKGLAWGVRNYLDIGLAEDIIARRTVILVKCVCGIE